MHNYSDEMQGIEEQKACFISAITCIKSRSVVRMLFDEKTAFWCNGPDYIADEYSREMGTSVLDS